MSAATKAEARIHEADEDETATTSPRRSTCCWATPTSSPLRRFLPGMSGVRFTAALARRPQRSPARRSA